MFIIIMCSETEAVELLWPIIAKQLLLGITAANHPELKLLREPTESYSMWLEIPAEELLLRWVNHFVCDVDDLNPQEVP